MPPAPYHNTNAAKPDNQRKDSLLAFRVSRPRKSAYVRAARPEPVALWAQRHLDRAAGYKEPNQ